MKPRGIFRMLDQLPAKVVGLQVIVRTERMHDPHLVAGAAGGDIEALLEKFLIPQRKRTALGGVDQRDEHHVALISLELRGVSAEYAMEFVAVGRDVRTDQVVNFDGLLVTNQRNRTETHRLTRVILLVFGLLDRGGKERGEGQGFLAIDLTVATGPRDAMGDGVRTQMDAARVAQGLDAAVVGNHVAELDDLRNATEMFDKASRAAERLACEIVD